MAFFRVGDQVTFRKDIAPDEYYKMETGSRMGITAKPDMVQGARDGKPFTIISIKDDFPVYYTVRSDDGHVTHAVDEMLSEYINYKDGEGVEYTAPSASDLLSLLSRR